MNKQVELKYNFEDIEKLRNIIIEIEKNKLLLSDNFEKRCTALKELKDVLKRINQYREKIFLENNDFSDSVIVNLEDFILVNKANNIALSLYEPINKS